MARLEEMTRGTSVRGLSPHGIVVIESVQWHGDSTLTVTYRDSDGNVDHALVYRYQEPDLEIVTQGRPWSFDAEGDVFRLVSEAKRIRLAHLFDPHLAVHTSIVDPLPHQITAVYGEMLARQPLRFLLADDPGAGKTIMAGLLMKELKVRGDLKRCLVVCPGSLAEQWQDELFQRFNLHFEILTNDRLEASRTGNALAEIPLLIARLDKLSRNSDLLGKLEMTDWDLVICDEAHKMSASFFGGDIKETKRYKLGKLLSRVTRHFLLMTATPHNGKEEDFQLFMALLDGDRFEGKFRDGVHTVDTSDLMRRMVKEQLVKFDGTPLFPERHAYTVAYQLSNEEAVLYKEVTDYVREEFNRAEALENDGRKGTVGFALTILQRRLASSPEAIYQSLRRRRERLRKRLREEELLKRGQDVHLQEIHVLSSFTEEDWEELEDVPRSEAEKLEEEVVDQATAARTLAELRAEIAILKRLEQLAKRVCRSDKDVKWQELSNLLHDDKMFDVEGHRRKLVIFTEHRDTLQYLANKIRALLGRQEAVVTIQGGMGREERRKVQEAFTQNKEIQILIATDAAGEGINLQRAHLMVNYDLPWNPNRLEQRFGRIHRIGQTEVCHLWNLLAAETREGEVYLQLLRKLDAEREALGGSVFDVLGKAIDGVELRQLLIEAIRYGDRPEVKERLNRVVADRLERDRLKQLIQEKALVHDTMDTTRIHRIKEQMERAAARRLQPHFIASFFIEAFQRLGGSIYQRERGRYEITHVPAVIRHRDRMIGTREAVYNQYERICFDKSLIHLPGKPPASFVCPGHPLLDATIDLILEQYRDCLKSGAVLVNENEPGEDVRALCYLEHAIRDGRTSRTGERRVVSRRLQFIAIDAAGQPRNAGDAPYLDCRPLEKDEQELIKPLLEEEWLKKDIEEMATQYAITHLVPRHLEEVKGPKEVLIRKTRRAVRDRLLKEINFWDQRAAELQMQEQAGKVNAKINSAKARQRADELQARLQKREEELKQEMQLSPLPPVVIGGALVVPHGLLNRLKGYRQAETDRFARETERVEKLAMEAVMEVERRIGFEPRDVSRDNCGYDIESRDGKTGKLRFIEVKGRMEGADTVTVTRNEIMTARNKGDQFILALVRVPREETFVEEDPWKVMESSAVYEWTHKGCAIRYVRQPFHNELDFTVTSVNFNWKKLWEQGVEPHATAEKETD